jgi:hexosaminidase
LNLLPYPRFLKRQPGYYRLPSRAVLELDPGLPAAMARQLARRLGSAAQGIGVKLLSGGSAREKSPPAIQARHSSRAPEHPEGYALTIGARGIHIHYREAGGLRAAAASLRQLLREYGRKLPRLSIRDYPDFGRRGVMLDISRGRVPKLETLLGLVDELADFKVNEFQLYTEHTFAYRKYRPVWQGWGPLTGRELARLDARCRELGIDLVPNQNSFGHLRYWLEYPPLKKLAEALEPYECEQGTYLRYPSTLAPKHPDTLPFLRELYDELLPHFSSRLFNVGCDETWDLGRGQSKQLCKRQGKGRVYLGFLKQIHREVSARQRRMMFWGDIIVHYPKLIRHLPKDCIALNWGYEANHPFAREARLFERAKVPFYVSPGTSTWMSLIGRHDNAFANLRHAAKAGRRHGALGYLNTDWGDGGHPQPLAVSYLPYLVGAAVSWCGQSFDAQRLVPVLSRDVFHDSTQRLAQAALALGFAHRKFGYCDTNITPFGAVLAAPVPQSRELACRHGLKYYARIPEKNVRVALAEVERQRTVLREAKPSTRTGAVLALELDLAARMAAQSCKIMLWQQALASGKGRLSKSLARQGMDELRSLERDFRRYWPRRNKGTIRNCAPFLRWRREDYRRGLLHFPPEVAQVVARKTYAAD